MISAENLSIFVFEGQFLVNYAQKYIFLGVHTCANYRDLDGALGWSEIEDLKVVPCAELCRVT